MICDAHIHLLQNMDAGSENIQTSLIMSRALYAQGLRAAILCPVYRPEVESISKFCLRRGQHLSELKAAFDINEKRILLIPSAEVPLTDELVHDVALHKLLIPGTSYLPCVLPLEGSLSNHTVSLLTYLIHKRDMIPYLLHLERYLSFLSETDTKRLTSMSQCVFSVSVRSLHNEKIRMILLKMLFSGKTVLPATNAHNLISLPPETRSAQLNIDGTHAERVYRHLATSSDEFFRPLVKLWRKHRAF